MKKDEKISEAINNISDDYIKEAADLTKAPERTFRKKYGALAAAIALIVITGVGIRLRGELPKVKPTPDEVVETNVPEEKTYAFYTPSIELPELDDNVMADMIGCVVYKGHVYTQAQSYYEEEVNGVKDLVGDYLGEAKGSLDEWSTQSDYATEFASTYDGPVYSVKGYDDNFRVCIYNEKESLSILENYDHIGLTTGNDLFEERLHLKGNIETVTYENHKDWDNGVNVYKPLEGISQEEFDSFIETLCESSFEEINYETTPDFYNAEVQGHLFLKMKDGTEVEMRLIDGGYAGLQSLGWYYVKMPGKDFDRILNSIR